MKMHNSHKNAVDSQFGEQANAYLTSAVHAQGNDLQRLSALLAAHPHGRVLDLGCGAGHASFTAAVQASQVVAYDLSAQMLDVVLQVANTKGLKNIEVQQGVAEALPFSEASFDWVISRYSVHHWQDVGQALREVKRVLKPGGTAVFMDVVSPGQPLLDLYLQTVEVLRDTSHVRNYTPGEWLRLLTEAGLVMSSVTFNRLELAFSSWVARMRTPEHFVTAIRAFQQSVCDDVKQHFAIQPDGTFTCDVMMLVAMKG